MTMIFIDEINLQNHIRLKKKCIDKKFSLKKLKIVLRVHHVDNCINYANYKNAD